MASIPPPPDDVASPGPPPTGSGSKITILAIVAIVAVVAIIGAVIALANSGDDDGTNAAASTTPSGSSVGAPEFVTARSGPFRIVLGWAPAQGVPADRYVVSRNGTVASNLEGTATSWVDDDVVPGTHYAYSIAAVATDGTSEAARITTETAEAPPATAPLEGVFDVHIHATSHFGFSNFGSGNGTLGWRFTPTCKNGPCDTKLADLHVKEFRLTLGRSGASYHGDASITGQVRCGSAPVTSSVTITVHVTDGGVVDGDWVATRVEGTMVQSESAQLGCVASGATYDVTGKIVR